MLTIDDLMPLPNGIELTQDKVQPATWHLYVNGRYHGPTSLEVFRDNLEIGRAIAPVIAEGLHLFETADVSEMLGQRPSRPHVEQGECWCGDFMVGPTRVHTDERVEPGHAWVL